MSNSRNVTTTLGPKLRQISPTQDRWRRNGQDHSNNSGNGTTNLQSNFIQQERLNVLVADHHPVVLAGVAALLAGRTNIKIVGQARDGREAVEKFLAIHPDVGLFEVRMPLMDGIEAMSAILAQMPSARLVMFTNCQSEEDVYRAVRAGAQGYVLKHAPAEELVESICAVAAGRQWIPPVAAAKLERRIADRDLTSREKEILLSITSGKSNKEAVVMQVACTQAPRSGQSRREPTRKSHGIQGRITIL